MSRVVHKFLVPSANPLRPGDPVLRMALPDNARIVLTGQDPHTGDPALWAEAEIGSEAGEGREFAFFSTGARIPDGWDHVGSALCGRFAWHIYEREQSPTGL